MINKKRLKDKAKAIEPTARIGKNGLTLEILEEIKKQLKTRNLVKIKLLRTFIDGKDKKEVAKDIALKCKAELIDMAGFVVVLYRR